MSAPYIEIGELAFRLQPNISGIEEQNRLYLGIHTFSERELFSKGRIPVHFRNIRKWPRVLLLACGWGWME